MGTARPAKRNLITTNGYVAVFVPDHPLAMDNGYVYEHRLIMERKLGRLLLPGEQVHHIDGNKQNNAFENLEVVTDAEHKLRHRKSGKALRLPGEPNLEIECRCGCGGLLFKYDGQGRPRQFISGHNLNAANSTGTNLNKGRRKAKP